MRAALGIVLILAALFFGVVVVYLVAYEIAEDQPQYASFYAIEDVRGWVAAAILGGVAAVLAFGGFRLLRRQRY
jgi:hypothetical protein